MKMVKISGGGAKGCQSSCFTRRFGRILDSFAQSKNKIKAFTLAEVLITLAIIGVVAALTIPTVVTNYQKKMYVTQLKKSYNTLTNGFKTYMAGEGVTDLENTTLWKKLQPDSVEGSYIANIYIDEANEEFKNEFLKIFKTAGLISEENYNIVESSKRHFLNGNLDDEDFLFSVFLADGAWIAFEFRKEPYYDSFKCGNRVCGSLKEYQEHRKTTTKLWKEMGTILVDINGAKGPNVWGRDVFAFILGSDGTLFPIAGVDYTIFTDWDSACADDIKSCDYYWDYDDKGCSSSSSSIGYGCAARIMEENWQMNY